MDSCNLNRLALMDGRRERVDCYEKSGADSEDRYQCQGETEISLPDQTCKYRPKGAYDLASSHYQADHDHLSSTNDGQGYCNECWYQAHDREPGNYETNHQYWEIGCPQD